MGSFIGTDSENALFTTFPERPTFDPNELNRRRTLQEEKIRQQTALALGGLAPGKIQETTLLSRRRE